MRCASRASAAPVRLQDVEEIVRSCPPVAGSIHHAEEHMASFPRVAAFALLFGYALVAGSCGERSTVQTPLVPSPVPSSAGDPGPPPPGGGAVPAELGGFYQVTFVAEGCLNTFPDSYRTRTYASRLEQRGTDVTVVLTGVPAISWFPEPPLLWGAIGSDRVRLTNYMGNDQWYGLFEVMSPTNLLSLLVDEMTLHGSSEELSGTFVGAFLLYEGSAAGWPYIVSRCHSKSHGVTITR